MTTHETLQKIRATSGTSRVDGLTDETIATFLAHDEDLATAIEWAGTAFDALVSERPELVALDEEALINRLQADYVNFYSPNALNPFVALAAKGPWMITLHGAVVHDSGGYGMLGFGHSPDTVHAALGAPQVMANIMTANVAQLRFVESLRRELGHSREEGCPFERFVCMNSGSEAMSVAARITDVHSKNVTAASARHAGKRPIGLGIVRAFHGRTFRPACYSDSTRPKYERYLASFDGLDNLWTIPANDVAALREAFARAERENVFIEALWMEPVQGEGAPGMAMSREFYDVARELTLAHDSLLVVDSIQAGLRAWGTLSIVDYPGFQDAAAPDIESWSKALNGGQYPLSVLGLTQRAADEYVVGVYGNTMTTNPRALDVACATLALVTDHVRANIRDQGAAFLADLRQLQTEFPEIITEIEGTGLLFCAEMDPDRAHAIGPGSAEERCRMRGVAIIHGGKNALRFTPHFRINDAERALMMGTLRAVLSEITAEQTVATAS